MIKIASSEKGTLICSPHMEEDDMIEAYKKEFDCDPDITDGFFSFDYLRLEEFIEEIQESFYRTINTKNMYDNKFKHIDGDGDV